MKKLGFAAAFAVLILIGFSAQSDARVNVSIGVNVPPFAISAPPNLVVVPGTYVYYVPEVDEPLFFYSGFWYRTYDGNWYRSRAYNGRWVFLRPERVPGPLVQLPPDYRGIRGYRAIPHRELQQNWRRWERNRYWERDEWWRQRHRDRGDWDRGDRGRGDRDRGHGRPY